MAFGAQTSIKTNSGGRRRTGTNEMIASCLKNCIQGRCVWSVQSYCWWHNNIVTILRTTQSLQSNYVTFMYLKVPGCFFLEPWRSRYQKSSAWYQVQGTFSLVETNKYVIWVGLIPSVKDVFGQRADKGVHLHVRCQLYLWPKGCTGPKHPSTGTSILPEVRDTSQSLT